MSSSSVQHRWVSRRLPEYFASLQPGHAKSRPSEGNVRPRRVVIIETQIKQYRQRFLTDLAARLARADVELRVAYSDPSPREASKRDTVELDAPIGVKIPGLWLFNDRLLVQPAWRLLPQTDLVIVEQGNRLLFNHALIVLSQLGLQRVAYWGHGYNRQAHKPGLSEWYKRKLVRRIDWWFSYTDGVTRYLESQGMPSDRITTVYNTVNTDELRRAIEEQTPESLRRTREELQMNGASVGLYCGALTRGKRIDFVLEAALEIRARVPDFELVVIGDGPERAAVEAAAAKYSFVHYVGPLFGAERARYFALAKVFLLPDLVGLSAVDAFSASLPVITTRSSFHGPEIEYVSHDVNGYQSEFDVNAYAGAVARILNNPQRLSAMSDAASATAERLSLSNMVESFAQGILRCLGMERST